MVKRQHFVKCRNAEQLPSSKLRKTAKGFQKSGEKNHSENLKHSGYEARDFRNVIADSCELNDKESDEDFELENTEAAYREPTAYNDLLNQLGTRNSSVATALKRRQQEEQGKSDTDDDSSSENISKSVESDGGSDTTNSHVDFRNGRYGISEIQENILEDDNNDAGDDDGDDDGNGDFGDVLSESDEGENSLPFSDKSVIKSSFDLHYSYTLASSKVEDLLKRKCRYTWKIPALNLPTCNWRGTGDCFMEGDMNSFVGLKLKLYRNWLEVSKSTGSSKLYQSNRSSFFAICNSYYDILHHNKKPFYLKGLEEDSSAMDAYLLHCLNHIFKSRDLMSKNDRKLSTKVSLEGGSYGDDDAYLDRGFTRPKVLILLPLAGIARRIVKRLIELTPPKHKASVENLKRFYEEFGSGKIESEDGHEGVMTKLKKSNKPPDFEALLGRENDNDHFMIGIKFTNRAINLYGDFYTSDVIVASPLGLITKIAEAEVEKEKDVDYLSSIEILIIDHADVMLMQNWSHVKTVVENLNRLPSKQHGTDIMRIRPWYLEGQAQFYRQTIILSSHIHPEINVMFTRHCLNHEGKVKLECKYKGVLPKILTQVRQIYERFDTASIPEADDARLKYFCEKVFPTIKDSVQSGVMIFISSYFEFVRLRNYLKSQDASFCLFGEYIKTNDISHVRGQFFRGERKIMLYTERAHFYYRYKIRGVQNLIIYSLPERKEFYPEILNFLEESDNMNCRVIFSRLDNLRLERIVGSAAAKRMIDSEKGVFVFA